MMLHSKVAQSPYSNEKRYDTTPKVAQKSYGNEKGMILHAKVTQKYYDNEKRCDITCQSSTEILRQ